MLAAILEEFTDESLEAKYCEEQADTLKKILVCLYGTTGSYWNKYGNVVAFEEINSKSRAILLKTKILYNELGLSRFMLILMLASFIKTMQLETTMRS